MSTLTHRVFARLQAQPRLVFLIDGLGGLLTLGCLVALANHLGMPRPQLLWLWAAGALFATYSLGCYWFWPRRWPVYLLIVAVANLLYCLYTLALLYRFYGAITTLGFVYFYLEIGIIVTLVIAELRLALSVRDR